MEKKLTPMMQLREKLQEKVNEFRKDKVFDYTLEINAFNVVINLINVEMLPIEREHMLDVFKDAQVLHAMKNEMMAQQYYTETFKTE